MTPRRAFALAYGATLGVVWALVTFSSAAALLAWAVYEVAR